MEYKKLYQKYNEKNKNKNINDGFYGGNYNANCLQISKHDTNSYSFNSYDECQEFNNLLDQLKLNRYNMNKTSELSKLNLNELIQLANYTNFWKLYLNDNLNIYEERFLQLIHYAIIRFNEKKYINFWMKMAKNADIWTTKLEDNNHTALHMAISRFTDLSFINFWIKMAGHVDLWKMQLNNIGPTPLHLAITHLNKPEYVNFWEIIAKQSDLWKISQITIKPNDFSPQNIIEIENNEKTPLHLAPQYLNDITFINFWNNLSHNNEIWKIQLRGGMNSGKSPLYFAIIYLNKKEYINFWTKMAHKSDLWKQKYYFFSKKEIEHISLIDSAVENFRDPIYKNFWITLNKNLNFEEIIGKRINDYPFILKENIFEMIFPLYKKFQFSLPNKVDYYISAHGDMSGNFFKIPKNITVIFLTKAFSTTLISPKSNFISGLVNPLLTTIKMCKYNNILRIYNPSDLVPDVNLQFFDKKTPGFEGILSKPDTLIKTQFIKYLQEQEENVKYDTFQYPRDITDDIGIFSKFTNKKNIDSTLHFIINHINNKLGANKNYTIVVGSCRVSQENQFNYKTLCKHIQLIDKTEMKKTRYDSLCNTKPIIITKNFEKKEIPENEENQFIRQETFASPEEHIDEYTKTSFNDDINYALSITDHDQYHYYITIYNIKSKLNNHQLLHFSDIISIYKIIKDLQEKKYALSRYNAINEELQQRIHNLGIE
jgi:hypothetical protein